MKVDRLSLIVVMLFFELFNSRNAMAQRASLTIRMGDFISVCHIRDHVYFSSAGGGAISLDSLVVTVPGPFEMRVISEHIDIGKADGSRSAIPPAMHFIRINGLGLITFPLQSQLNTCVSITAL